MVTSPALLLVGAVLVLGLGFLGFAGFNAQRSLTSAKRTVLAQGRLAVEIRDLAPIANPGFKAVAAPALYSSGAWYNGHFYLSGPTGLSILTSTGELLKTYRAGPDLPAATLGQIVVGKLHGASAPELLIATSGEGVLIFSDLSRSDGSGKFRQLLPHDKDAKDVTALLPLPGGDLLIGTRRKGLLVYTGSSISGNADDAHALSVFNPEFAQLSITSLAADAGGFWAGTHDRGVLHWHAGQTDAFRADDIVGSAGIRKASLHTSGLPSSSNGSAAGLPDSQVQSIAVNGDNVFVGTPVGVQEFKHGIPSRQMAPGIFANTLFATNEELLIGSIDQGIQTIPLSAKSHRSQSSFHLPESDHSLSEEAALQFLSASATEPLDGNSSDHVSLAVMRDGLHRESPSGDWTRLQSADFGTQITSKVLSDSNISALAFSPDGRLWVGYFDRGLDILSTDQSRLSHLEDDRLFCINRIVLDPRRNTMAVATANGLTLFDEQGKPRQTLTKRDGLIADHINDVLFRSDQMVVATPAGLTFVDATGVRSLYAFEGLVNNHVYALAAQPGNNQLLAGTLGGISVFVDESIQRNLTQSNSGLRHNWITAIIPAAAPLASPGITAQPGSWLIGTYGAGILQLDAEGHFTPLEGATHDMVINPNAMYATRDHVFAGSLGQGLWVRSNATARWTQITAGLPSLNVTAIAERDGQVYVGTDNGLVRIGERLLP